MKKIFPNFLIEFNFILFPFFLVPFYFLVKSYLSPELTFLIFLVLFGETHFASSFLFFNKENKNYIIKNMRLLIIIPVLIGILYFTFSIFFFKIAVLIGAIASGIHVTRQSVGISKLYAENRNLIFELLIYFSSLIFLTIGFFRFYFEKFKIFEEIYILDFLYMNFVIYDQKSFYIILVLFFVMIGLIEKTNIKKKIVNATSILIYSPYLFTEHIYDAIIIGVSAHWLQYLALNYKIYFYKKKQDFNFKFKLFSIFLYSIIMSTLGYKYHFSNSIIQILISIPLTFQFIHYYIDAFIWRFSIREIRENIGSKLFAI